MHAALTILDLGCAALNGYWFVRAFKDPVTYPAWFCIFTGTMTVYCLAVAFI